MRILLIAVTTLLSGCVYISGGTGADTTTVNLSIMIMGNTATVPVSPIPGLP